MSAGIDSLSFRFIGYYCKLHLKASDHFTFMHEENDETDQIVRSRSLWVLT